MDAMDAVDKSFDSILIHIFYMHNYLYQPFAAVGIKVFKMNAH